MNSSDESNLEATWTGYLIFAGFSVGRYLAIKENTMAKITVYLRKQGTRQYVLADPKFPCPGSYVLRYRRNGKRVWETLPDGTTYPQARHTAVERECDLLNGITPPKATPTPSRPVSAPRTTNGGLLLDEAIDLYLANNAAKSGKTASAYAHCMQQFYGVIKNKPMAAITQQDLINFVAYLRADGCADRTISNRVGEVVTFLRSAGIKDVTLKHKYVEKKIRAYRADELKAMFAAATPDEWLLFQFFLCTGGREQEVQFAEWGSIDFTDKVWHIRQTALFTPKDYEESEIPLPDFLVAALKQRLLNSRGTLIFPTALGRPNGHMLRTLKDLVARAGLVGKFGLHVFRKSYATIQHKSGVDARTIQTRLGHSDLSTTLAYLEGEDPRSERSRDQVNGAFAVFA
jgi:integrase/recombinase XerD